MKNIISVLAVLVFFLVSTSAFAEGPMKLPEGAKADAKKHNKEGIKHWGMGHYDVALKHFSAALKKAGANKKLINSPILKGHLGM